MPAESKKGIFKRVVVIVAGCAFLGSTAFGVLSMLGDASQEPVAGSPNAEIIQQLEAQEKNYALVVEREPENKLALEGLVQTRIQLGDFEGAIAPTETLLAQDPDNQVALQGLVQAKIQQEDFEGAIAPMEKLVALNPERPDYEALLAQLKQQQGGTEVQGGEE
jgi:predicted Zn-dependent protease